MLANVQSSRVAYAFASSCFAVLVIAILYFTLKDDWAHVLLDRGHTFPLSVQNGMWIAFFIGLGEIISRRRSCKIEIAELEKHYLPEDNRTVLQASDLSSIYRIIRENKNEKSQFLPRLIERCVLQFQASKSADQSASLLNTSLEMFLHEIDLNYNVVRYICWVIPSLGFIGTVVGIGRALEHAGDPSNVSSPTLLTDVTGMLAVSFNGTFLALVMASILVLIHNITQAREEHILNSVGQYCLDNLINRLYVEPETFE